MKKTTAKIRFLDSSLIEAPTDNELAIEYVRWASSTLVVGNEVKAFFAGARWMLRNIKGQLSARLAEEENSNEH